MQVHLVWPGRQHQQGILVTGQNLGSNSSTHCIQCILAGHQENMQASNMPDQCAQLVMPLHSVLHVDVLGNDARPGSDSRCTQLHIVMVGRQQNGSIAAANLFTHTKDEFRCSFMVLHQAPPQLRVALHPLQHATCLFGYNESPGT